MPNNYRESFPHTMQVVNLPELNIPEEIQIVQESNDKPFTPADGMTLARPLWAFRLAYNLIKGNPIKGGATLQMAGIAGTDAEGQLARGIDRMKPGTGFGVTEHGANIDPVADTIAFGAVAVGHIFNAFRKDGRTSKLGALGVGLVLGKEAKKATWMTRASKQFKKDTGENLAFDVNGDGKKATMLAFGALVAASLTHDLPKGKTRAAAGIIAAGLGVFSFFKGEKAMNKYKAQLPDMTAKAKKA